MEPNKFEENIRTKFEERELQPSAEAWSKLEAQLGTPRSSNRTLWYAIAASLVAILVVGSFLLKENKTVSNEIVQQTIPAETENKTEVVSIDENTNKENSVIQEESKPEVKIEAIIPKKKEPSIAVSTGNGLEKREDTSENSRKRIAGNTETAVAKDTKISRKVEVLETIESEAFIKLKIDEVVAQVGNLQNKNSGITAADVEVLLQQAQRDISNQRLLNQATTTIDPASLLNDVETELERGFRDKVFDALGEGFNKIRTAVVERNN